MAVSITPETLSRHELIGLDAEVASAPNPDLVGVAGSVVGETTKMLDVEASGDGSDDSAGRVARVPKAGTTFAFTLPDDSGSGQTVTVDGDVLVARPARRTEQTGDSKWR